jgi:hypothetical protein
MATKEIATLTAILGTDDDVSKAIIAQDKLAKGDKDWNKSEIAKLKTERDKHLDTVDDACRTSKEGVTDNLVLESINLQYKIKKNKIKAHYEPLIKALEIDGETMGVVAETVTYTKAKAFGAKISTPFKAIKGLANGVAEGTGLKNFWQK